MITIAIDGACRKNGKPECYTVGSVFIKHTSGYFNIIIDAELSGSTNQRGEIKAAIMALQYAVSLCSTFGEEEFTLITDSEYIYNAILKEWPQNWRRKGWITSLGEPVKNRDLWEEVIEAMDECAAHNLSIAIFHVKGHLFSLGKVTAAKILETDQYGEFLYRTMQQIVTTQWDGTADNIIKALELFEKNHGYAPPLEAYREMIACNLVADLAAGYHIDRVVPVSP